MFWLLDSPVQTPSLFNHLLPALTNKSLWDEMISTGIHFLSGGMSEEEATLNLQALQVILLMGLIFYTNDVLYTVSCNLYVSRKL